MRRRWLLTLKASCYETFYQSGETSDPATGINTRKMFLLNLARAKAKLKWVSFEFWAFLWIFLSAGLGEKTQDCRSTSSGATRWTTPGGRGWVGRGGEVRLISHSSSDVVIYIPWRETGRILGLQGHASGFTSAIQSLSWQGYTKYSVK